MTGVIFLDRYLRSGTDEDFAELLRRHGGLVYAAALRRVGERAAAEKVAEEVFTRLARRPPRVTHEGELVA